MKIQFRCAVLFFSAVLLCFALQANTASAHNKYHKQTVRVGIIAQSHGHATPVSFIAPGFEYELLQAISQYTGWSYEYVTGYTRLELLPMLLRGEIDLLNEIPKTPEREKNFLFADIRSRVDTGMLVARADSPVFYGDNAAINTLTIGELAGYAQNVSFAKFCSEHNIAPRMKRYTEAQTLKNALQNGEIDAAVSSSGILKHHKILTEFAITPTFYVTRKDDTDLMHELNYAMLSLRAARPYFFPDLERKYSLTAHRHVATFTKEEQAFLTEKRPISVLLDTSWAPFEYKDPKTGEFRGINIDIYKRIAELSGLQFTFVDGETTQGVREHDSVLQDLFVEFLTSSFGWAKKHNRLITQPVVASQILCITRDGNLRPKSSAQVAGGYLSQAVKNHEPLLTIKGYPTPQDCLDAVLNGETDATYLCQLEVLPLLQKRRYSKLFSRMVEASFQQELSIAVSKHDDPRLLSILSKCLVAIPQQEIADIVFAHTKLEYSSTWKDVIYENPIKAIFFAFFVFVLLFCLLGLFIKNKINVRERQRLAMVSEAKSDFFSRMSHDIRTPLNAILGISELGKNTETLKEAQDYFSSISTSGNYLLLLLNDTLDMRKIEEGKMTLALAPHSLQKICNTFLPVLQQDAEQAGIHFSVKHVLESEQLYMLDRMRFTQIMANLISNAIKFTPKGKSITVRIEKLAEYHDSALFKFTVRDTGIGIDKDFLPRLFSPFEQSNSERTGALKGSGLGLSIVKSLVEMMQGTITVDSKKDQGTTFTITLKLPKAPDFAVETGTKPQVNTKSLRGQRVLVAEDNAINIMVIRKLLENVGVIVEHAENGAVALTKFAEHPAGYYGLILMDIRMPVMDGLTSCHAIRSLNAVQHPDAPTIPIVAVTANAFEQDEAKSKAAGMTRHLAKPIEPQKLYAVLRELLGTEE